MITKETRAESLNELDKTKRYEEIRYALKNEVEVISKRYDKKTKRNVAVYALNDKKYYEQKSEKIEKAYNNYLNEKTKENIEKWKGEVTKDV